MRANRMSLVATRTSPASIMKHAKAATAVSSLHGRYARNVEPAPPVSTRHDCWSLKGGRSLNVVQPVHDSWNVYAFVALHAPSVAAADTFRCAPTIKRAETVEAKVKRLAATWRRETEFCSSTVERFEHPAYKAIVALGERALPGLMQELALHPDFWFWAIDEIVGERVLPESFDGDFDQTVAAYREWWNAKTHVGS